MSAGKLGFWDPEKDVDVKDIAVPAVLLWTPRRLRQISGDHYDQQRPSLSSMRSNAAK